jgi:hypothetical protein
MRGHHGTWQLEERAGDAAARRDRMASWLGCVVQRCHVASALLQEVASWAARVDARVLRRHMSRLRGRVGSGCWRGGF